MNEVKEILGDKFDYSPSKLEFDYNKVCEENSSFKKIANSLDLPKSTLMKYTTKIENSALELNNCKKCKNLLECKNSVCGHVYYPVKNNDDVEFCYIPCKYQKEMDEKTSYMKNIYSYSIPSELLNASMKDIHIDDKNRVEVITWIKKFLDNYLAGNKNKGLYLTGNFGCGKTYLLSAMLNELAKKGKKIAIVYYPEFLRDLKENMWDNEEFSFKYNKVKNSELLLIDDIGAESVTSWSRDEILGPILQYRMENNLSTFFTSNLTISELEEHLSDTKKGVDKVKARRIIERIKQLAIEMTMIAINKRK